MPLENRIAVTVPAFPNIADTIAHLQKAEALGITDAWFSDAGAPDTLTTIAALAHHTQHLRIGVAVTPVYTRTPAVLAASAYVLAQLLPQRFVLGLGSSSQTIMENWNGVALEEPVARVTETTELLRLIMRGEKTNFDGRTLRSKAYRQPAIDNPPPLYLAALRPRMIEAAAAVGDGVIFNLWPNTALEKMMDHVRIGAERAGKPIAEIEIVNRAMVLCTDDVARGRDIFRSMFAPYYATPVYNQFLAWAGYGDAASTITAAWQARDRAASKGALSDDLVDEIAIIGDEATVQARVRSHAKRGIHTTIVAPLAGSAAEIERTFAAFSPANFKF